MVRKAKTPGSVCGYVQDEPIARTKAHAHTTGNFSIVSLIIRKKHTATNGIDDQRRHAAYAILTLHYSLSTRGCECGASRTCGMCKAHCTYMEIGALSSFHTKVSLVSVLYRQRRKRHNRHIQAASRSIQGSAGRMAFCLAQCQRFTTKLQKKR